MALVTPGHLPMGMLSRERLSPGALPAGRPVRQATYHLGLRGTRTTAVAWVTFPQASVAVYVMV
jgi:hypothetical protein